MPLNSKIIKKRIGSIKNTKKITKAMEMVSASKMRKAVESTVKTRKYAQIALDIIGDLSKSEKQNHKFLEQRKVNNVLIITISSNRGLCGNYNVGVINKLKFLLNNIEQFVDKSNDQVIIKNLSIGKKAGQFVKKQNIDIVGLYDKLGEKPTFDDILPITRYMLDGYINKEFDKVFIIYTNFISALSQKAEIKQLLPATKEQFEQMLLELGADENNVEQEKILNDHNNIEFEFEPDRMIALDYILPRLVEIQLYQCVLESSASEHSSRMVAMKNAHDAAGEIIKNLTLEYNKARQAAITKEISEIVAGADALQ
jgi:F-type H+-transporting ATPase subunit gamma